MFNRGRALYQKNLRCASFNSSLIIIDAKSIVQEKYKWYFSTKSSTIELYYIMLETSKPDESQGRKATGLRNLYGSRVAEHIHLFG